MLQSHKLKVELSQARERLGELSGRDALSEDEQKEMRSLTDGYKDLESRYRAAVVSESEETPDAGEEREKRGLVDRVEVRSYVDAMISGAAIDGAEKELNESEGLETRSKSGNVVLPWAAITPRLETRADATTNIAATTDLPGAGSPWLTRLFDSSWIGWSGITARRSTGEPVHIAITGGADASLPDKGTKVESDAMTITAKVATPRRVSAVYRFSGVDEMRTSGMLSRAIENDVRRVIMDKIEGVVLNGASATDGFDGLSAAITATPDAALSGATGTGDFEGFLSGALDGKTASIWTDLKILMRPGAFGYFSFLKPVDGTPYYLDSWMKRGTMFRSTGHISEITGQAGESYMFIFRSVGMPGAIILSQWSGIELVKDVYSRAQEDEVTCTARTYVDLDILRSDHVVKERIAVS